MYKRQALGPRDARCAACGDAPSAGAPRGEAIASYDYDAFLGERAGCCQRNNGDEPSKRTIENDIASSSAAEKDALPAALDDAAAAAARRGRRMTRRMTHPPSRDKDSRVRGLPTVPTAR